MLVVTCWQELFVLFISVFSILGIATKMVRFQTGTDDEAEPFMDPEIQETISLHLVPNYVNTIPSSYHRVAQHSTRSSPNQYPKKIAVLGAIKVISALIVLLHHIPALDATLTKMPLERHLKATTKLKKGRGLLQELSELPDEMHVPTVWNDSAIDQEASSVALSAEHGAHKSTLIPDLNESWRPEKPVSVSVSRQLTSSYQQSFWGYLLMFGIGPGKIAVETFLIVTGMVFSLKLKQYRYEEKATTKLRILARYQQSLLKRFPRLAFPVVPVQVVHLLLYRLGLAYGNYNKFPKPENIWKSLTVGLEGVFASDLNGALWVLKIFLFAPFFILAVEFTTFQLVPSRRRFVYLFYLVFLSGNIVAEQTISPYLSVFIGNLLVEFQLAHSALSSESSPSTGRSLVRNSMPKSYLLVALLLFSTPWIPWFYGHLYSRICCATGFTFLGMFFPPLRRVLQLSFWDKLSKYTFQLYLWHLVVFNFFGATMIPVLRQLIETSVGSFMFATVVLYLLAILSALLVAYCAYYLIERPSEAMVLRIERVLLHKRHSEDN